MAPDSAGPETFEAYLFEPSAIPWGELAFSSISITLQNYIQDLAAGAFRVHHGVIDKRPGSQPNDPGTFALREHLAVLCARPEDNGQ